MADQKPYGTFSVSGHLDQQLPPSGRQVASSIRAFLRRYLLLLLLISSIIIGVSLGLGLRSLISPDDAAAVRYIGFLGELLMRSLKMLILPLIVSSLVAAMSGLEPGVTGKIGSRALIYYFVTTLVAMAIGMALVYAIQPGAAGVQATATPAAAGSASSAIEPLLDLLRNMLPDNLIEACFRSTQTGTIEVAVNGTVTSKSVVEKVDGSMNVLGLVVYSILLGAVLVRLGPAGKPLLDLMISLQEATMAMINLVIWFSPIGILSLVAAELVKMADPMQSLSQLGLYLVTVLAGLAIHGLCVLPLVYAAITRRNPLTFLAGTSQAMATAFGTSSSSATLPMTYKCLEENNKIDKRVTRFILPIGATVNMNGTALYEAVAPIFIAQMNGIPLDFGQLIAIALTATCAAVGAAGIPQAGLVTMVIVLNAVGLPTNDIAKILAVDWFLDRFRTMINVLGDCFGAGVVEHLCREELRQRADATFSDGAGEIRDTEPLLLAAGNQNSSSSYSTL